MLTVQFDNAKAWLATHIKIQGKLCKNPKVLNLIKKTLYDNYPLRDPNYI